MVVTVAAALLLALVAHAEEILVGLFVVLPVLVLAAPWAVWKRWRTGYWPS
jgi:hypothetical protein